MLNGLGSPEDIAAAVDAVQQVASTEVGFTAADLRRPEEIEKLVAETLAAFGSIDVLVNNAGIQHVAPVQSFPTDRWDDIIAINLSSAFHTIRCTTPAMLAAGRGRIINIASAHALVASPFKSAYVAAKHGIAGLTKTVALELAENNITVNAIAPGYVRTALVDKQIADTARARGISEQAVIKDVMLRAQPTRRFVTVEEIAALVVFLCSDAAASITGSILPVEGGWLAA
jgi:3-hydroxybutyrate dehydrogenase